MTSYDPDRNPYLVPYRGPSQDPYSGPSSPGAQSGDPYGDPQYPGDPYGDQYPGQVQPWMYYGPGASLYGPSTERNALGGWALGLGIAGMVCSCAVLLSIPAIVLGLLGIHAASEGRASNRGMAVAGVVLGMASIGLWVVLLLTGIIGSMLQVLGS